jgi:hypothetical protein
MDRPAGTDVADGTVDEAVGRAETGDGPVIDGTEEEAGRPLPGSVLWARSTSTVFLNGVVEGSTGVVVTGTMDAPANLGGALLAPVGLTDTVLAQFARGDAAHLSSTRFGGGSPAGAGVVRGSLDALDSGGAPLVRGVSSCNQGGMPPCNKIDLGVGLLDPGGGPALDGFVGRYSISTGQAAWVTRLLGPGEDLLTAVASGPNSTVFIAGWFNAPSNLVANAVTRTFTPVGDRDIFVGEVSGVTGEIGMTKTFAGTGFEQAEAIAWTGNHIIVAGTFAGSTTFGAKTVTAVGDFDVWVAKLVPTDGTPLWAISLGGTGRDVYPLLDVDSLGDVYVVGTVTGSAMFGTYRVGGSGKADIFLAKLRNSDGEVVWATSFGSTEDDGGGHIAVSSSGKLVASATIGGPIESGGAWAGNQDGLIVSYDASGARLWTKVIGSAGTDYGSDIARGTDAFYACVNLGGDVTVGLEGVNIIGAPRPSGILLKLAP